MRGATSRNSSSSVRTSSFTSRGEGHAQLSLSEDMPVNSGELVGSGLQCNTTASSVEGAAGDPQALVWCCLREGSSVTQAVEAEVVVRGWLDQGLQAAVGLTQQCHPEVVSEFAEGKDGYWPLVGRALGVLVGAEALWKVPLLTRLRVGHQATQHHGHWGRGVHLQGQAEVQWGAAADRDVVGEVPRPAGISWSTVLGGDGHRILQHLDGGEGGHWVWLAPGLSGLGRAQARLCGPSAGPAMETKAGAVLGFALSPREGDYRAGHRLQALWMLEVTNAIG